MSNTCNMASKQSIQAASDEADLARAREDITRKTFSIFMEPKTLTQREMEAAAIIHAAQRRAALRALEAAQDKCKYIRDTNHNEYHAGACACLQDIRALSVDVILAEGV